GRSREWSARRSEQIIAGAIWPEPAYRFRYSDRIAPPVLMSAGLLHINYTLMIADTGPLVAAIDRSGPCHLSAGELVHFGEFLRGQFPISRLHVLGDLLGAGRAGNYAGNLRLRPEPCHGQLEHRVLAAARELLEPFEHREIFVGERLLRHPLHQRKPGALWRLGAAPVFSGQKSTSLWKVRQDTYSELAACGDEFAFDAAVEQVVLVLRGDVRGKSAAARYPERIDGLPRGEVTASDIAHLAGADEIVQRLERFLLRRLRVRRVNLIQIDIVSAQPFKARLGRRDDVAARRAAQVRTVAHRHAKFGRDDDLATAISERLAEQLFGAAPIAVYVGGVEQRDAVVERLMHHGARLLRVASHAKVVASQSDRRNLESRVAKLAIFHDCSFRRAASASRERRPLATIRFRSAGFCATAS